MKLITIAGNIGKSAEIRKTQGGDSVAGFSVAVSDRDKNTTWFDCSLWGKRADALSQYLTKGSRVTVCGDLSTREYEGKTYLQVRVSDVTLQGGGQSGGNSQQGYSDQSGYGAGGSGNSGGGGIDDEIPFAAEWRA